MEEIFDLINEMSPFLLLGFLLAGLMHAFVPNTLYTRYLSGNKFSSVVYSALFGVPLPLCSCGVIPTSMSLRREGASKGATVSFLVSTPQTGVDSIIATYSLMGLPFAIIRPLVAFCTAIFAGQMVNVLDKEDDVVATASKAKKNDMENLSFMDKIKEALKYGFVEMMEDIGKWLVIGLVIAGLITVLVPDSFFEAFKDNSFLSILFVLLFSIPMYLCATGSIPIAVALMLKGLTPGAALVLLMAGPASNMASILVINKVLGKKTLLIYLSTIICGAILFALGIDYLLPREWFVPSVGMHGDCCDEGSSWFSIGCTILMALLLINALIHKLRGHSHCHCHCHEDNCECCGDDHCDDAVVFHIKGMNCNHCRTNAEKAILSVEGVESASVILETGEAKFTGHADKEAIKSAVEALGFEVDF
ncbi:MAG: permease [Bacteroidaceae bacterium]|nr:permease [Bacteroidaceae bacterium]